MTYRLDAKVRGADVIPAQAGILPFQIQNVEWILIAVVFYGTSYARQNRRQYPLDRQWLNCRL